MKPLLSGLAFAILICVAGCNLQDPPDNGQNVVVPDKPIVQTIDASDVFEAIAKAIDNGTLKDTQTMAQVVTVVSRNGYLNSDGKAKFDSAFPDATSKYRVLGKSDSATLRGIK